MTQSCKTCRWAIWQRSSKSGRRQYQYSGQCGYEIPTQTLPDSVTKAYGYHEPRKSSIQADCGEQCPCYEKETKQ